MPYDYKGSSELVWQPNTSSKVFPSGLVFVQRDAIIRKDMVAAAREALQVGAVMPCESASYIPVRIYPQPQESEQDGFVTFTVTGYGKATGGRRTEVDFLGKFYTLTQQIVDGETVDVIALTEALSKRVTIETTAFPSEVVNPFLGSGVAFEEDTFDIRSKFTNQVIGTSKMILERMDRTNYGAIDEIVLVLAPLQNSVV
jgi:hypothetical protein